MGQMGQQESTQNSLAYPRGFDYTPGLFHKKKPAVVYPQKQHLWEYFKSDFSESYSDQYV